ncbi:MAG: aldo/keto reductase [Candidatus Heimdallarchaeota archaeon]
MEERPLGNTGEKITILGLGGFHLLEISLRNAVEIVTMYLDQGGCYIETAAAYGNGQSEQKIGKIMRKQSEECFLATKCHVRDKIGAMASIEHSLRNLNTDHVDILFMHAVQTQGELNRILAPDGAIHAAEKAREAGKIRYIGITLHGVPDPLIEAVKCYPFDVIMTGFNYYDRFNWPTLEEEFLPLALKKKIGLIGMKPLADGYLWRSAELAFRYAWSLPLSTVVAGINTLEQLEQDLVYAENFRPMTQKEKEKLFCNAPELGDYVCRQCGKCLPCPEGIDIPRLFMLEGYYDRQMWDGQVKDPADFALRHRLRFWFNNKDLAQQEYAKKVVKANACTSCEDCLPRCPYKLLIIEKLRLVDYKLAPTGKKLF